MRICVLDKSHVIVKYEKMCYLLLQKTVVLSECSSFSENESNKTWIKSLSGKFLKSKCIEKTYLNLKSASFLSNSRVKL